MDSQVLMRNNLPVSKLKTVEDFCNKFDALQRGRQSLENQWKLNLAFYKGRQYAYVNRRAPIGQQIQTLPTEDGEKPRYRIRLVSNQIITGAHSLLSKYTKTKPVVSATPGSGSMDDVKAAQMAERLLEFWWDDMQLDDKLAEALLWAIITGQGYWKITWDAQANKQMSFTLGPDGKPIVNDSLKSEFRSVLQQYGIEPQEKTVYLGDVKVEAMSPFDVYLDPTAKTFDECKYAICIHSLDPDEVKARWGVEVDPDASANPPDVALPFGAATLDRSELTVKQVYIGYFKPTPSLPKGRYVVWMGGKEKKILVDQAWPYPSNDLPLVKFPGLRTPGSVYDGSHVEQSIPVQKELNRTLSQIVEYKNLTIRPRVWAPTGSVRTRLTSEPGGLYEFNPIGQFRPEIEKMPVLPPYVFELLSEISGRLKDIFGLTDVSEGQLPPNLESGIAIDLLQELSADRIAPTVKLIEKQLARGGQIMLTLAQKYYIEPRLLAIKGSGGGVQVQKFTQADIAGGVTIHVETGSGMPRTRAGRQAQIERWVEMNLIPADKAWKYIDMADLKGLAAQFQADEDQAQREIEKLIEGVPINPEAQQDAMQAVQQGKDPQTGDPIQSPQQAQQILQDAGLQPRVGENYDVHLDVLSLFMKSVEFDGLPMDARQRCIKHWNFTLQAKMSLPVMPEPAPVKTTLQLKGTVGPTAAAQILDRSGVPQITPEVMAEPPLETWVSDSVDKPDTDAAGPGQEANQLSQAAATVLQSNAQLADAQQQAQQRHVTHSQQVVNTQEQHDQKVAQDALKQHQARQAIDQANELHAQKLRHADEAHQEKLKQLRKPQPKAPAKGR